MSFYETLAPIELVRIYMKGSMRISRLAGLLGCTERDIVDATMDIKADYREVAAKLGF